VRPSAYAPPKPDRLLSGNDILEAKVYWGCARRGGDGETNAAFAENLHEYSTEGRTWRFAENLHVYLKAISLISFYQYLLPSLST
jgi:hypothetical protein